MWTKKDIGTRVEWKVYGIRYYGKIIGIMTCDSIFNKKDDVIVQCEQGYNEVVVLTPSNVFLA